MIINKKGTGKRIKQLFKAHGLTVKDVATIYCVSTDTVLAWFAGKSIPRIDHLLQFYIDFNIDISQLFVFENAKKSIIPEISTFDGKEFGTKILNFRKNNNMSQREFAKRCGINQSYVSQYERSLKVPTKEHIEIISRFITKEGFNHDNH